MLLRNSLEEVLRGIDLETLLDADKFKEKTISLGYIGVEDDSYPYQDRRWMLYTIWYSTKFQALRKSIGEDRELQLEVFDNLSFFIERALSSGYKTIQENEKSTSPSSTIDFALINGVMGNSYLWVGKFILENSFETVSRSNLEKILTRVTGFQVDGDKDDLAKFALRKAVEHYEDSKKLGNIKKENYGQLGTAYFYLATLSDDPTEKFKGFVNAIVNLELSRQKDNREMENDCGIANAYQELGHFSSRLDLFIESTDVEHIGNFIKAELEKASRGTEKDEDLYYFLKKIKILGDREDKRFDRKAIGDFAKNLLRKAESVYIGIHEKRIRTGQKITRQDYSYRGKCRLRLGKLTNSSRSIDLAIKDLENAIKLKDPSPQIRSLLGEAYFTLAHYTHFPNNEEKRSLFSKALDWFLESETLGNNGKESYGMMAECYRHLLKLEIWNENSDTLKVQRYLDRSVKYAIKAGGRI